MGLAFALTSMLCWAVNIFITRAAMARMPAELGFVVVLAMNLAFGSLVLAVELALRNAPLTLHWEAAGWFVLSGVVGIYLGRRMLLDAVQLLGPSRASVLHTASPAFTLIGAWLLVGETLGAYELGLMAMIMAGLWCTQPSAKGSADKPPPSGALLRRAALLSLLTVAGFGIGNAFRGMAMRNWDEAVLGALISNVAALVCLLAANREWRATALRLRAGNRAGLALFALSGVATMCGTVFGSLAMQRIEIAIATLISYTTPLVVFPVSVLLLKDRDALNLRTALGAALVLTGIALLALR